MPSGRFSSRLTAKTASSPSKPVFPFDLPRITVPSVSPELSCSLSHESEPAVDLSPASFLDNDDDAGCRLSPPALLKLADVFSPPQIEVLPSNTAAQELATRAEHHGWWEAQCIGAPTPAVTPRLTLGGAQSMQEETEEEEESPWGLAVRMMEEQVATPTVETPLPALGLSLKMCGPAMSETQDDEIIVLRVEEEGDGSLDDQLRGLLSENRRRSKADRRFSFSVPPKAVHLSDYARWHLLQLVEEKMKTPAARELVFA